MKKRIAIVGPKHVGKSVVGKQLAEKLNLSFFDLDDMILNLYNKKDKENIRELYAYIGGKKFRDYEVNIVQKFLPHQYVLSPGGGIADNNKLWEILKNTFIITLETESEIAWKRVIHTSSLGETHTLPSFLHSSTKSPKIIFKEIFDRRMIIYKKKSHYICNTYGKNISEIVTECLQIIKS